MKRILFFMALVLTMLLMITFVSCQRDEAVVTTQQTNTTTTTATTTLVPETEGFDLSKFSIVRYMKSSKAEITATKNLKEYLESYMGVSIKISTDEVRKGETLDNSLPEILVGATNRDASVSALEKLNSDETSDYIIEIKDNKVVLIGKTDEGVFYAIKEFVRRFVKPVEGKTSLDIKEDVSVMGKIINDKVTVFANGGGVETLFTSTIHASTTSVKWPTYERIVQLQHSGENNGILFATGQWSEKNFPVYKSTDDGKTWELISRVSEQIDKTLTANWQPHIYELPNQVGEMPAGTLLLSGCAIRRDAQNLVTDTYMCIWRSYDLGETWEEFTVVDNGGGTDVDDGMYEPYLICDKDGSLVCFYSDETEVWETNGQRLVFKVSKDGVNWGEKQYCVALKDKTLRPGMVTVAQMGEYGYILSYEMIGEDGGPVYVKTSDSLTKWDAEDKGKKITTAEGDFTGCTPYCAWTPAGGKYGTVIAAGRFAKRSTNEGSKLFVSYDLGETWYGFENPLPYDYKKSSNANYAYSFGFFAGSDGCIYYVNNCFPDIKSHVYTYSDMKMAKIKIY